tara:strand:+ start:518 stop:796 length:279 start_codon:yes stop_codon:yes gene_type:complete
MYVICHDVNVHGPQKATEEYGCCEQSTNWSTYQGGGTAWNKPGDKLLPANPSRAPNVQCLLSAPLALRINDPSPDISKNTLAAHGPLWQIDA